MTYSIIDQASNKFIDMEICKCTQAGNSNRIEKSAFVKVLNRLKISKSKCQQQTDTLKLESICGRKKKYRSPVRRLAFLQKHKAKVEHSF